MNKRCRPRLMGSCTTRRRCRKTHLLCVLHPRRSASLRGNLSRCVRRGARKRSVTYPRTDKRTDNVTAPEPAYRSIYARKLRIVGNKSPSPSCFSIGNMKVVVLAEASFLAIGFRSIRLISLSTRLLCQHLCCVLQKCPIATWQADVTPDTQIDDIKLDFCQQNGLSLETCVLSSKGALLKDQPKVCLFNVESSLLAKMNT